MSKLLHIEDVLQKQGYYISTTVGTSMYPMLRNRKDTIIVRPVTGKLKKYDIPLYRRGDNYVLHRIVGAISDGRYIICGDNCLHREYGITDEQIIGVLTGFRRGEKEINMKGTGYRSYCRVWVAMYPIRYLAGSVYLMIKRIRKRIRA